MNMKKIFAGIMACCIMGGALPLTDVIPENIASASDDTLYIAEMLNGYTMTEINASEIKPRIYIDSKVISADEISEKQTINIIVEGASEKYCSTGMHIYYDPRLTLCYNRIGEIDVKAGDAISLLSFGKPKEDPTAAEQDMKGIFVATAASGDYGEDGVMWTLTFELPEDAAAGDVYPIDILYKSNENAKDLFTNKPNNSTGQLMQAYTFTKGIYNSVTNYNFTAPAEDIAKVPALANIDRSYDGYIAVSAESADTTTTTTTTTSKITTTTTTTKITTTTTTTTAAITTAKAPIKDTIGDNVYLSEILNNYKMSEIEASEIKPHIYIDSKVISADEISEKQEVSIMVKGADMAYSSTGLHIYYDPRLNLCYNEIGKLDVSEGPALKYLAAGEPHEDLSAAEQNMSGIFLATAGYNNYGRDGVMWTLTFKLPEDARAGDIFPIDIFYKSNDETEDLFTNVKYDLTGTLMNSYTFTKGIYNSATNCNFAAPDEDIAKVPALADIDKSYDGYIAISGTNTDTDIVLGDANCDGKVNLADATAIVQHLGNRDKYGLSEQGIINADCCNVGDGVTGLDALAIQMLEANIISKLPYTE